MPSWVFTCLFRLLFSVNLVLQILHWCSFSFVWVTRCLNKWLLWQNPLSHFSQQNSLSVNNCGVTIMHAICIIIVVVVIVTSAHSAKTQQLGCNDHTTVTISSSVQDPIMYYQLLKLGSQGFEFCASVSNRYGLWSDGIWVDPVENFVHYWISLLGRGPVHMVCRPCITIADIKCREYWRRLLEGSAAGEH